MLVLPDRSMMADETNGPMKEEVLPMMLKRAKKRNWALVGFGGGKGDGEGLRDVRQVSRVGR
jgi:hypothetical protein